jgi:hypothetical protein
MEQQLPADFDWVAARNNCSLSVVFKQLEIEAEKNVNQRNALGNKKLEKDRFQFIPKENYFVIMRGGSSSRSVAFSLKLDHIYVEPSSSGGQSIRATLTLNNLAECKLKVNNQELERWQLLRMALEDLFAFEDIE